MAIDFPSSPAIGQVYTYNGIAYIFTAQGTWALAASGPVVPGLIMGVGTANNAADIVNDIDIAAGWATDSTNSTTIALTAALTKRLDATWVVGSAQGGREIGSTLADGTWHVFLIAGAPSVPPDVIFSQNALTPSLPSTYTIARRIASVIRVGGAIKPYIQAGNEFLWASPTADVNLAGTFTTSVRAVTLPSIPLGLKVQANIAVGIYAGAGNNVVLVSSLDQADVVPAINGLGCIHSGAGQYGDASLQYTRTNTSGQIRVRGLRDDAYLFITTLGYVDTRGGFESGVAGPPGSAGAAGAAGPAGPQGPIGPSTDINGVLWSTGDRKETYKTVADAGWIMMDDGTIGDAASGSSYANVLAQALFALLWAIPALQMFNSAGTAVGRGASAAADWAAHARMALPKVRGRVSAGAGAGAGLTTRALGGIAGEETHSQSGGELFAHAHSPPTWSGGPTWFLFTDTNIGLANQGGPYYLTTYANYQGFSNTGVAGSSAGANVVQPSSFVNYMIKL